jgi:hypothetical protein
MQSVRAFQNTVVLQTFKTVGQLPAFCLTELDGA